MMHSSCACAVQILAAQVAFSYNDDVEDLLDSLRLILSNLGLSAAQPSSSTDQVVNATGGCDEMLASRARVFISDTSLYVVGAAAEHSVSPGRRKRKEHAVRESRLASLDGNTADGSDAPADRDSYGAHARTRHLAIIKGLWDRKAVSTEQYEEMVDLLTVWRVSTACTGFAIWARMITPCCLLPPTASGGDPWMRVPVCYVVYHSMRAA